MKGIPDREIENYMTLPSAIEEHYSGSGHAWRSEAAQTAFKETERRLYTLPILRSRIKETEEELEELEGLGIEALKKHSGSFVSLIRPGMRLDPEEVHAVQMAEASARLLADRREVRKLETALEMISDDPYYRAVELRYIKGRRDADIAEMLCCDVTTARRNRSRLVHKVALRLYGMFGA